MMKVSELIEKLNKCNPDANVKIAHEYDKTTDGYSLISVAQFTFFGNNEEDTLRIVQLQCD